MMKYKPINSLESPRFAEVKTFMRLPYVKTTEGIDYAIVGVPFDTGVTYRTGQRFGPNAIRDISSLIKPFNVPPGCKCCRRIVWRGLWRCTSEPWIYFEFL